MSTATDNVDIDRLRNLMKRLSYSKVALDVPADIRDELLNEIETTEKSTAAGIV